MNTDLSADRTVDGTTRGQLIRRVWRAPGEHGAAVIDPAWDVLPQVLETNRQLWSTSPTTSSDFDWVAWRSRCREACLAAAMQYTSQTLGMPVPKSLTGPLIAGGHQPELFHPGVWAKNFALYRLAKRVHGVAVHLIVDSDASSAASITVPAGTASQPRRMPLAYDAPRALQPWEAADIIDPDTFASFGDRVASALRDWNIAPIARSAWPAAVDHARRTGKLVQALTAARVSQERQWGVTNLELPVSQVCRTAPFHEFAAWILLRLPEFVRHHNQVLNEYRQLNRVRSRSHPVPELMQQEGWWEAPFWVWRDTATLRDRPWVRCVNEMLVIRDQTGEFLRVPAEPIAVAKALSELETQQMRFRTRALTTTLFARLGLADLFVHGLGGAKYDEMTDALMVRVFDRDPPRFLTVSATLHLPFEDVSTAHTPRQRGELRHQLRDYVYNPQRYVQHPDPRAMELMNERQQLLDALHGVSSDRIVLTRGARRECYLRLQEIRRLLQPAVDGERQTVIDRSENWDREAKRQQILRSREYSWVLFPREQLEPVWDSLFP